MQIFYKDIDDMNVLHRPEFLKPTKLSFNKDNLRLVDVLLEMHPKGFEESCHVFVNKQLIEVENFDIELNENDLVLVSHLPEDPVTMFIYIVVSIVISLVIAEMTKPDEPWYAPDAQSVYSSNIRQIESKLNSPIQIQYGTIRQYPKLISTTYKFYIDNIEHHLIHTCLGIGDFDIKDNFLNDTNINELKNETQVKLRTAGKGDKSNYFNEKVAPLYPSKQELLSLIAHNPAESNNIEFNAKESAGDPDKELGFIVMNPRGTEINRILINLDFRGGIYGSGESGDTAAYVKILFRAEQIDDNDEKTGYYQEWLYEKTALEKTPIRLSHVMDLQEGRYQIGATRQDFKIDRDQKGLNITSFVGLESEGGYYSHTVEDLTLTSYLVKVGEGYSSSSGLKMNVLSSRAGETMANGDYNQFYSLLDFVKDMWTNEVYGMGEDLAFLEIRQELSEKCSLVVDRKQKAFDLLNATLKSFGYVIYPYLNKFVIDSESKQTYRSMIFNSRNCRDIEFSYNLPDDNTIIEGNKVRYLPSESLNFESVSYPTGLDRYEENVLMGVDNEEQAMRLATRMYRKKLEQLKTCSLTTDLEGLIPEIGSRVGVSTEYVEDTFVAEGESLIESELILKQKIKLLADTQYYCIIDTSENNVFEIMELEILEEDSFTDTLTISSDTISIDPEVRFAVTIGDKVEVVEDYTVMKINTGSMTDDLNDHNEIKLDLQEYLPELNY